MVHVLLRDSVRRSKDDVVSFDTIDSTIAIVDCHVELGWKSQLVNFPSNAFFRVERLFGFFVLHKLNTPEKTFSPNVSDIWVVAQHIFQSFFQIHTSAGDILQQIFSSNDFLNLQSSCCLYRHGLKGQPMNELTSLFYQNIHDFFWGQHGRDGLISTGKSLADSLDVGYDILCLPCMQSACPTHSTHDFVKYEKSAMSVAYFLHSMKIARDIWNTSKGGTDNWFSDESNNRFWP